MKRWIKYIVPTLLLATSCYKEDFSNCPRDGATAFLRFVYDYNMSYEDLFHNQVSRVEVYCFDRDDIYLRTLTDESASGSTFPREYTLEVPEDIRKEASQYITWAGVPDGHYQISSMTPGTSRMTDLRLSLMSRTGNQVNVILPPLWYGSVFADDSANSTEDNTQTIPLVKDTNVFRIILQSLDDESLDVEHFDFRITSPNGSYNYLNQIAASDLWVYEPYVRKNDPATGAIAELNTLRLVEGAESRLVIQQKSVGSPLLDINLNDFLNELKLEAYSYMSLQEYMDREDDFRILVFIRNENPTEPENPRYVAANVSINGWEIREQE